MFSLFTSLHVQDCGMWPSCPVKWLPWVSSLRCFVAALASLNGVHNINDVICVMCYDVTHITALAQCGSVGTSYFWRILLLPHLYLTVHIWCTILHPLPQNGNTAVLVGSFNGHKDLVQELCETFGADFLHKNKVRAMQTEVAVNVHVGNYACTVATKSSCVAALAGWLSASHCVWDVIQS